MKHGGITEQQKASVHRRKDAAPLQIAKRWRGAMYLLGYSVECSLKTSLMEMYRVTALERLQPCLSERFGTDADVQTHSLRRLMAWTNAEHRMDSVTTRLWGIVCKWTVDWRYNPDGADETECEEFFQAGDAFWSSFGGAFEDRLMQTKSSTVEKRIIEALCKDTRLKKDTIIDVSQSGMRQNLHVLVVSRVLDDLSEQQKQEYLWGLLDDAVKSRLLTKSERQKITLVLPFSVEELRR